MSTIPIMPFGLPIEVAALLNESAIVSKLDQLLSTLLCSCREIGVLLREGEVSSDKTGTSNVFGDEQLDVDIQTDAILFGSLRVSGLVHVAASEEKPVEEEMGGEGFSVAFDPLDGSSIVDANFAVGTIVGVFPGRGLQGRVGREQVAALFAQYGPRVTIALAIAASCTLSGCPLCLELTLRRERWIVSRPEFKISSKAKTFAPGNLRATSDNERYRMLVTYWIENKYTLRYSGGLVPDIYHILIKGEGVLANASSPAAKAKLRLLFEAAPIAFIIECAGGLSCVCSSEAAEPMPPSSLLDVPISDLDKRVGVCFGSSIEVDRFRAHIF